MHEYEVVESRPAECRLTLRGTDGQDHHTQAPSLPPPVGSLLMGARPHLGLSILLSTRSGNFFPVIFESVSDADSVQLA